MGRLSDFKFGMSDSDEIKADRDCAASGCLKLQCIRNYHVSSLLLGYCSSASSLVFFYGTFLRVSRNSQGREGAALL